MTVSRAIRHPEMVSEELRTRIDDAVLKLAYIPNHLASALAGRHGVPDLELLSLDERVRSCGVALGFKVLPATLQ